LKALTEINGKPTDFNGFCHLINHINLDGNVFRQLLVVIKIKVTEFVCLNKGNTKSLKNFDFIAFFYPKTFTNKHILRRIIFGFKETEFYPLIITIKKTTSGPKTRINFTFYADFITL
jgi:hypothetical protein